MDVEVSLKTQKLARQHKLAPEQMAFADLIACGWPPEDAWATAIRKGMSWTRKARTDAIEEMRNMPTVKERINTTASVLRKNQVEAVKEATNKERKSIIEQATSKEQMLFDLQTALATMTIGSKEWLDTKKLIVDVTMMKKDEMKEEESTIHHFLPVDYPLSCEYCLFSRCDDCRYKKAVIGERNDGSSADSGGYCGSPSTKDSAQG